MSNPGENVPPTPQQASLSYWDGRPGKQVVNAPDEIEQVAWGLLLFFGFIVGFIAVCPASFLVAVAADFLKIPGPGCRML